MLGARHQGAEARAPNALPNPAASMSSHADYNQVCTTQLRGSIWYWAKSNVRRWLCSDRPRDIPICRVQTEASNDVIYRPSRLYTFDISWPDSWVLLLLGQRYHCSINYDEVPSLHIFLCDRCECCSPVPERSSNSVSETPRSPGCLLLEIDSYRLELALGPDFPKESYQMSRTCGQFPTSNGQPETS